MTRLPLWRPTLLRRVFGALLLAFALVAVLLLGLDYIEFKQQMARKPGVQALAEALVSALAEVPDAAIAGSVVAAEAATLNRMRLEGGLLPGEVEFELRARADGRVVFATPTLRAAMPQASGALAVRDTFDGSHWLGEAEAGPWRLTLAEPKVGDVTVLGWLGGELAVSLLLSFPLVLLPLWIAVRRGMRPLTELADELSQRDAQDLAPISFKPRHDELSSLVAAFDGLLGRLQGQLQRERAFVQDAAHELRTPLAAVAAHAHLLAHADDLGQRREAADALGQAVHRAAHLSRQLLTLASLDEGRAGGLEALDLAALLQQVLALAAPQAQSCGLDLSLDAPDTLPTRLERASIVSVVQNLLENALRYVPRGGRVAVRLGIEGSELVLTITDDGPGIPPAQRAEAFERFWRGQPAGEVAGSGLGLAIVRKAAARLGGHVILADGFANLRGGHGLSVQVRWPQPSGQSFG